MSDYYRQISSAKDNYERIATEAGAKANGSTLSLLIKAILGGWMVGLGGYAASFIASLYYVPNTTNASARAAFALVFPVALMSILFTGCDLYTGNTMCFTFALFNKKINPVTYVLKLMVSIAGNYIGTCLAALVLSGGTGHFMKDTGGGAEYMMSLARAKTSQPFWRIMLSAIGCNSLVCLAVWMFYCSYDSGGACLNILGHIGAFAVAGLEHIIANFYILNAALLSRSGVTFVDVYVHNFIPTWMGNTFAGIFVLGIPLSILYNSPSKEATLEYSRSLRSMQRTNSGDIVINTTGTYV
ncbi:formate/nitrate transporter [Theileria orientalis]|uniref:Formate-nitrite transporter n=1 Tax=Theileria orientalis TaxID=68886 RepID=A0A976QV05_THEOR|nr:formate/nitrate transporter [Theileria orientalis]